MTRGLAHQQFTDALNRVAGIFTFRQLFPVAFNLLPELRGDLHHKHVETWQAQIKKQIASLDQTGLYQIPNKPIRDYVIATTFETDRYPDGVSFTLNILGETSHEYFLRAFEIYPATLAFECSIDDEWLPYTDVTLDMLITETQLLLAEQAVLA